MKLPSIVYLVDSLKTSFLRFPLTILSASVAVCIGVYLTEYYDEIDNQFPYINLLLTSALGIPLYFCISIFGSKKRLSLPLKVFSLIAATMLLALIYYSLPNSESTHNTSLPYIRYGIFNIIIHLLVSFLPYVNGNSLNGFWNYNKILFLRFLTTVLYSGVLYIGLILALSALHLLFNVEIHDELYGDIFIVIIGLFNTWLFVSGIPADLDRLEEIKTYPNALKVFVQYILLPILVLYLIILYAYGAKILIEWNWPKGIVSYLISCISVLGVLTLLLIHPYGNLKGNEWIKKFTEIFYYALFPLVILLFIAISIRIGDYGITINRYVIVLLGIWLTLIAVYFSLRKTNIKFIPISLSLILSMMSFGPWGMFSMSERSQVGRITKILGENSILINGKIKNETIWLRDSMPIIYTEDKLANRNKLSDSLHNEVISILDYLDDHHGFRSLRPWFQQDIDSILAVAIANDRYVNEAMVYTNSIGLPYNYRYTAEDWQYYDYQSDSRQAILVSDYDFVIHFSNHRYLLENSFERYEIDGETYDFGYGGQTHDLQLVSENDTATFQLTSLMEQLMIEYDKSSEVAKDKMVLEGSSLKYEAKIEYQSIQFNQSNDSITSTYGDGYLLLKKRN